MAGTDGFSDISVPNLNATARIGGGRPLLPRVGYKVAFRLIQLNKYGGKTGYILFQRIHLKQD